MPKKKTTVSGKKSKKSDLKKYVQKRLTSPAFKKAFMASLVQEIKDLSSMKIKDVIKPKALGRLILDLDPKLMDQKQARHIVRQEFDVLEGYYKKNNLKLGQLFDKQVNHDIDQLLAEKVEFSTHTKKFVAKVVHSEFITGLFSNILFVAVSSFNKKFNPVLGGLTVILLEKKIRAFIDVIIKNILNQVVEFVVSSKQQEHVAEFSRTVVHLLFEEKIVHFFQELSPEQRNHAENLMESLVFSAKFQKHIREVFLLLFNDFYKVVKNDPMGKYFKLKGQEKWLAQTIAENTYAFWGHPALVDFMTDEIDLALNKT